MEIFFHPHCFDNFYIANIVVEKTDRRTILRIGLLQTFFGGLFVEPGQEYDDRCCNQSINSVDWTECKHNRDVDRKPGKIEKSKNCRATQKCLNTAEIPHRLNTGLVWILACKIKCRIKNALVQYGIKFIAGINHQF